MSKQHLDYEDRLEQQYQRLGTRNPACVTCGESDPFCLELHHPAGREHHDDTFIECANCHRKLSDQQQDHVPPEQAATTGVMVTIGRYLLGLADMFALLVVTLREFGNWLISESGLPEPV